MIGKDKKMLQASIDKNIFEAMEKYCELLSKKLGINVSKGMLITHLFTAHVNALNNDVEELQKSKKEEN